MVSVPKCGVLLVPQIALDGFELSNSCSTLSILQLPPPPKTCPLLAPPCNLTPPAPARLCPHTHPHSQKAKQSVLAPLATAPVRVFAPAPVPAAAELHRLPTSAPQSSTSAPQHPTSLPRPHLTESYPHPHPAVVQYGTRHREWRDLSVWRG